MAGSNLTPDELQALSRLTLKSELRMQVATDFAQRSDDRYIQASHEVEQSKGAVRALSLAVDAIPTIMSRVDRDVDDGLLEGEFGEDQLRVAAHIKRYIRRCEESLQNLVAKFETEKVASIGKVFAYQNGVKDAEALIEEERKRIQSVRDAIERGDLVFEAREDTGEISPVFKGAGARPSGVKPSAGAARDLAARRAAAKKAKAEKAEAESGVAAQSEVSASPTKRAPAGPKKGKRDAEDT